MKLLLTFMYSILFIFIMIALINTSLSTISTNGLFSKLIGMILYWITLFVGGFMLYHFRTVIDKIYTNIKNI